MAYGYNPYPPVQAWQYPAIPQPTVQQPVSTLVKVTGIDGAKAYQLPPNSSAVLFDGGEDVFYLKTTDGAGFPTIRSFRFEEIAADRAAQAQAVTREEFDALKAEVARMAGVRDGEQPVRA